MRSVLCFLACLVMPLALLPAAEEPNLRAVDEWFATPPDQRKPPSWGDLALTRAQVATLAPKLWESCRAGAIKLGWNKILPKLPPTLEEMKANPPKEPLRPSTLAIGTYTMPFVLLVKGQKPKSGWPLFLALHGGGGNAQATGPHAWDVNTREWQAQMALFERVYEPAGIYFIPRMADDRQGRWYLDHNQEAFETVIRNALLFHEVDPNHIYMLGISEGGYGAIRFAGNRPDRFAATNGMAAAEPLDTSPPENMRNVGMRIDIGEQDTMFDRVGLARRMGTKLEELKQADPKGYDFLIEVQPKRGHGIDYAAGPKWIAQRTRNPWPDRVNWTVRPFDKTVALQSYWLALPRASTTLPLFLTATLKDNALTLTAETQGADNSTRQAATTGTVLVRLNDEMVDLDVPVAISVNGRALPPVKLVRRLDTLARTLAERCDPNFSFSAEIEINLAPP